MKSLRVLLPLLFTLAFMGMVADADAAWEAVGPGGGGQIQGLHLDPSAADRAFFFMDVEGAYRSDDGGAHWISLPDHNVMFQTYEVATRPGDANTVYLGTFWGLLISRDGGATWNLTGTETNVTATAYQMRNKVMGTVAVDPRHPDRVFCAPNWRSQDNLPFNVLTVNAQNQYDERALYFSLDSGTNWHRSVYEVTNDWKQVYSVTPDPADPAAVWLGTHAGLYRGVLGGATFTWTRIAGPPESEAVMTATNRYDGFCMGADLTPDGHYLYAAFGIDQKDAPAVWSNGINYVSNEIRPLTLPFVARVADLLAQPADPGGTNWVGLARAENKGMLFVPDTDTPFGDDYGRTYEEKGSTLNNNNINYWRPRIDPRSTPTRHKVLLGEMRLLGSSPCGLFEGDFHVPPGGDPAGWTGAWTRVFAQAGQTNRRTGSPSGSDRVFDYDFGWQNLTSRARHFAYSPTNWPGREIWVGNDQNMYRVTLDFADAYAADPTVDAAYYHDWTPVTTRSVSNVSGLTTHFNRGIVSTVDYNADAWSNYVVAVGADNALYESYDDGASWLTSQAVGLGQGDAALIIPTNPPMVLISQAANAFGGGYPTSGTDIYAKRLVNLDNSDPWIRIASGNLGGFQRGPDGEPYANPHITARAYHFASDPFDRGRVYIAANFGIYMFHDVMSCYDEMRTQHDAGVPRNQFAASTNWVTKIYDAGTTYPINDVVYGEIYCDADTPNTIYFKTRAAIIKGVMNPDGTWTFTEIYSSTKSQTNVNAFHYWHWNGDDYFVIGTPKFGQTLIARKNEGAWKQYLYRSQALEVVEEDGWVDTLDTHFGDTETVQLAVSGVAGYQDYVFCDFYSREFRRGVGVLRGRFAADMSSITWEDWTGPYTFGGHDYLYQSWVRSPRVVEQGGSARFYACTQGAGTWRREILDDFGGTNLFEALDVGTGPPPEDPEEPPPGHDVKPVTPGDRVAEPLSSTMILVRWAAVTNAAEYELQQMVEGDVFRFASKVNPPNTMTVYSALAPDARHDYRIKARNQTGASAFSTPFFAVTERTVIPEDEVGAILDLPGTPGTLAVEKSTNMHDWGSAPPGEAAVAAVRGDSESAQVELRLDGAAMAGNTQAFYRVRSSP